MEQRIPMEDNFTKTAENEFSPLHSAILNGRVSQLRQELAIRGVDKNIRNKNGQSPLLAAVRLTNKKVALDCVSALLEAGVDCSVADHQGDTSLHEAAKQNFDDPHNSQLFNLLLAQRSVSVNCKNIFGVTPLHVANSVEVARNLVHMGADPQARAFSQNTTLHMQVKRPEICRLLIEHGVQVNSVNELGATPLHLALMDNLEESVRVLISHGADANAKDVYNTTPIYMAYRFNASPFIKRMIWKRTHPVNLLVLARLETYTFVKVLNTWRKMYTTPEMILGLFREIVQFLAESPSDQRDMYGRSILAYALDQLPKLSLTDAAHALGLLSSALTRPFLNFVVKNFDYNNRDAATEDKLLDKIDELLGYGCTLDVSDLEIFYLEFGDCGLLRFAYHMDITSSIRKLEDVPLFLGLFLDLSRNLSEEVRKLNVCWVNTVNLFNVHNLIRHCTIPLRVVKHLEASYLHIQQHHIPFMELSVLCEIVKELKNRVPSLLELSRNAARVQLQNKYQVDQLFKMVRILKFIGVPKAIRNIILMKVPLYGYIPKPTYYPTARRFYLP